MFLPTNKAKEYYGVCLKTLQRWEASGKISTARSPSGRKLYECVVYHVKRKSYCYCCVPDESDLSFLVQQEETLSHMFPTYIVLKDIGVGVDRDNFSFLVEEIVNKRVHNIVVVAEEILWDKDLSFLHYILGKCDTKIIVPKTEIYRDYSKTYNDKKNIASIISKLTKTET